MPASTPGSAQLPRLGIIFDPASVDVMSFVRAGAHNWVNVWLVDRDRLDAATNLRMFQRFGEFVDVTGCAPAEVAGLLDRPLDGLIVTNEPDLQLGAEMAPTLGVPFASPEQAWRIADKPAQREALRTAGIPSPRYLSLRAGTSLADARAAAVGFTYPAVLKPAHGAGSRATREIPDESMLAVRLAEHGDPIDEDLILEERIPDGWGRTERPWADFLSVESIKAGERIEHFGLTGRFAVLEQFRETGNFVPAAVPPSEWAGLADLAEAAIRSLDPADGAFHTEIKLTPDGPRVIEVNGRLGGGSLVWATEVVSGRSLTTLAARAALGQPLGDISSGLTPDAFHGVAFGRYLQPPLGPHVIAEISGVDAVDMLPGVEEVRLFHETGSFVDASVGFRGYVAAVLGRVDDHDQLAELVGRIDATLRITYA